MRTTMNLMMGASDRILAIGRAHPSPDPTAQRLYGELATLREGMIQDLMMQRDGLLASEQLVAAKERLRRDLNDETRDIAGVAAAARYATPGLDLRLQRPPTNVGEQRYLTAARQMVEAAAAHKELLLQHGLADGALERVTALVDRFEALRAEQAGHRASHVGATAALRDRGAAMMRILRHLHTLERRRFRDDPERLAAWESARNIHWPLTPPENGAGGGTATAPPR